MGTIGIQECSGEINDRFSSPVHHQTRAFCDNSHRNSLQVLFFCISQELLGIFRINHYCHTLLRLRDTNLCSVKAGIFLRYFIQVNLQSRCQLTDGNRYTACTKVVALLDDLTYFFSSEQPLDLSLRRRVSFLHLSSAGLNGFFCVHF